jgi:hypothetical protein
VPDELDVGLHDARLRPRIDTQPHHARGSSTCGRGMGFDGDARRKIALRREQLARIFVGAREQALQLAFLQVGQLAKTLQFEVALEQGTQRIGRLHFERERGAALACGGRIGISAPARDALPYAATGQQQGERKQQKKQRRPAGRRCDTAKHALILTAAASRLRAL